MTTVTLGKQDLFSNRFSKNWREEKKNSDWFLVAHTVWTNRIADKKSILSTVCSRQTETKDQSITRFDKDKLRMKKLERFWFASCVLILSLYSSLSSTVGPPLWSTQKQLNSYWVNCMKLCPDMLPRGWVMLVISRLLLWLNQQVKTCHFRSPTNLHKDGFAQTFKQIFMTPRWYIRLSFGDSLTFSSWTTLNMLLRFFHADQQAKNVDLWSRDMKNLT